MNNHLEKDQQESSRDKFLREFENQKYGDDPNAVDRFKLNGLHEFEGKYYQQIGDEFFEVELKKEVKK